MNVCETLGELLIAYKEHTDYYRGVFNNLRYEEIGHNLAMWHSNTYYSSSIGMIRKSVLDKLKKHSETNIIGHNNKTVYTIKHESMLAISREYKINKLFSDEK